MIQYSTLDMAILNALAEDKPTLDVTSDSLFGDEHHSRAKLIAKAPGVLSGLDVFSRVFALISDQVDVEASKSDGEEVALGEIIAVLTGPTKALLFGERTALNFLQRMSGIATETHRYVEAVKDLPAKIVDTRKTAPGLRLFDKMAVRHGGAFNHRFNLSDGVLIKDNHIAAAGGISAAIRKVKQEIPHTIRIEVEVESLDGLLEAIAAGADIVMLDNMSLAQMKEAVQVNCGRVLLEASGNMNLETVRLVAETGVDLISVGKLTHSVTAMDISLRFE